MGKGAYFLQICKQHASLQMFTNYKHLQMLSFLGILNRQFHSGYSVGNFADSYSQKCQREVFSYIYWTVLTS